VKTSGDRFYMVKDMKLGPMGLDRTTITQSDLVPQHRRFHLGKGWYYSFSTVCERVVNERR
jgi:hypothetical protein